MNATGKTIIVKVTVQRLKLKVVIDKEKRLLEEFFFPTVFSIVLFV